MPEPAPTLPIASATARHALSDDQGPGSRQDHELKKLALLDLSKRATTGAFAYALGWLLVTQGGDFFDTHRAFVLGHAGGLALIGAVRLMLHRRFESLLDHHFERARALLRLLVLGHGFYWGMLLAAGLTWEDAVAIRPFITPMSVALLMAGTMIMAIEPVLGLAFPISVIAPPVVALLLNINAGNAVFALAGVGFVGYAWAISRVISRDYWRAQHAGLLLEDRARELELVSLTDALTQIPNRLHVDRRLPVEWLQARRQRQCLAVAVIDLDHFKRINDTHGHPIGDRCLREAAAALQSELLRPTDLVARYGGEEFLVLMPNTDEAGARAVAQRLLERVAGTRIVHAGQAVPLTCSIGVCATVPAAAEGVHRLIQQADLALYEAKTQGRNRVCVTPFEVGTRAAHQNAETPR